MRKCKHKNGILCLEEFSACKPVLSWNVCRRLVASWVTGRYSDGLYSVGHYSDRCGLGLGFFLLVFPIGQRLRFSQIWAKTVFIRRNSVRRNSGQRPNCYTMPVCCCSITVNLSWYIKVNSGPGHPCIVVDITTLSVSNSCWVLLSIVCVYQPLWRWARRYHMYLHGIALSIDLDSSCTLLGPTYPY